MYRHRPKVAYSDDGTASNAERYPPPYSSIGEQVVIPRSCTPEPIVCADGSINFILETPLSRKQDIGRERLVTTPSIGQVLVVDDIMHANRQCLEIGDLKTALASVEVIPSDIPLAPTDLLATRHLISQLVTKPALTSGPRVYQSDISSSMTGLLWSEIYIDMCLWLKKAWIAFPDAHFIFSGPLLTMGAAAHDNDATFYAQRRAECTTALLYYRAQMSCPIDVDDGMNFLRKHGHDANAAPRRERVVKQETTRIISWMNTIKSHADLPLMDDCLTTLVEKGIRLTAFDQIGGCAENSYISLLDEFDRSRAFCVAETCLTFGGERSIPKQVYLSRFK
jgi:hypothetical protein